MRKVIYEYYTCSYQNEYLGKVNENKYYSIDESMFCHDLNGERVWILGITENDILDYKIVVSKKRDAETMKNLIYSFIPEGNIIVTDAWSSYDFLDNPDSIYIRYRQVHRLRDWGEGLESTSHI